MPLPEMLALLRAWVEIETPSLEPHRVAAFADVVAAEFEAAGCRATRHADALQLDFGAEGSPVLLLGHLDTVYPAGTLATMPFRVEGERASGPGIFDMKGGVVQALFALRALRAEGSRGAVRLLFAYDEELGSPRSRMLTEATAREARAVLVLEPSADGGKLKTARKGIAHYRLTARGRAAHAGVDFEKGASAIVALAAAVTQVASWTDLERGITVNPGVIAGGSRANVVAAEAYADLDVRAWTGADLAALDARFRGLGLEVAGGLNRPPMEPSPAGLELLARAQAVGRGLGLELEATRTGGGSDGNFTAALGIPTLDGLGMVGGGAHAPHEFIAVDQLELRARLLARLLSELAPQSPPTNVTKG